MNVTVPRLTFSVLTNPYAPSTLDHSGPRKWPAKKLHMFAGCWLIVSGLLHFLAINLLSKFTTVSAIDWTPFMLSGLGLLVAIHLRIAIVFTRLMGSFAVLGLAIASVVLLVGTDNGGEWTCGDMKITDPQPWQYLLLLATIAATMIPPWWMLQRALAGNNRVHPSTRLRQF